MSSSDNVDVTKLSSGLIVEFEHSDKAEGGNIPQISENEDVHESTNSAEKKTKLLYSVEDTPPWYLCIPLSIQHYLTMFTSTVTTPYVMAPALCIPTNHYANAYILSTIVFVSGIVTLLQTTLGIRLPLVQGTSAAFYTPMFALMALPQWQAQCPYNQTVLNQGTPLNYTDEIWEARMCEIQGAIAIASVLPIILSATGLIHILIRYITPLVVAPTITLIGISLYETGTNMASQNWWVAISTIVVTLVFCLYMENIPLPFPTYSKKGGCHVGWFYIFKLFPILTTIAIMWLVCYILTVSDVLQDGNGARTDVKSDIIANSPWFRFPYPFQWGVPTVSVAGVFGMMAAVIATIIESVGDYFACARLSESPKPPPQAISRGILVEGFGCTLAGLWGTGCGTTTYGENISAIAITKVGSRRVIQIATIFMFFFGVITKIGAIFVSIPEPVVGGLFMIMFGIVTAVGLSNTQYVDLNSSRNLCILGFSIFFGLALPNWVDDHSNYIKTGSDTFDEVIIVILESGMLVGGVTGFILDNTVPGTLEERGLHKWTTSTITSESDHSRLTTFYDLPFGMSWINRQKIFRYLPFCPPFRPPKCKSCIDSDPSE